MRWDDACFKNAFLFNFFFISIRLILDHYSALEITSGLRRNEHAQNKPIQSQSTDIRGYGATEFMNVWKGLPASF